MKKIILTLCLFAATSMAAQTVCAAETNKTELSTQQPKNNNQKDSKDSRNKKTNYASEYSKQETEVKNIYKEVSKEKYNSRQYNELKKNLQKAQQELINIRTTAKRNDVKITASKWETVKVK